MKVIKIPSTKIQISNKSQWPKFKIRNKWYAGICARQHNDRRTKIYAWIRYTRSECFGHWILKFEIYLQFDAWNLGFYRSIIYLFNWHRIYFDLTLANVPS